MEFQDPSKLKPKEARELALKLQQRILNLENSLDDLMRSVEIAQYTKQFQATEVFVREAMELLEDRLTLPEIEPQDFKATIVEASEENLEKAMDIYKEDPTIAKRKHGHVTGIVDPSGESHATKKRTRDAKA